MRDPGRTVNLTGMLRRLAVATALAVAVTCLLAAPAGATVGPRTEWDVGLTGKVTTKWDFSGTIPSTCSEDYGSGGFEAKGSGSRTVSVATTAKRRLWAETYRMGGKLRFSSFAAGGGWEIPASVSKTGAASKQDGKPCDSEPDDPEPLPEISDASGCGTKKGTSSPSLSWKPGTLTIDLGSGPSEPLKWITRCPDLSDPKLFALMETPCEPKGLGTVYLSALKFMLPRPKKFTVEDKHRYVCPIPITNANWRNGSASLTIEISTSYAVTFTPRRP